MYSSLTKFKNYLLAGRYLQPDENELLPKLLPLNAGPLPEQEPEAFLLPERYIQPNFITYVFQFSDTNKMANSRRPPSCSQSHHIQKNLVCMGFPKCPITPEPSILQ